MAKRKVLSLKQLYVLASEYLTNNSSTQEDKTKEMEIIKNYLDFVAKNKDREINLLNIWK
jgi:hypothetical protein